ncbi:Pre-mRNA-splicing factor spp2 [Talaromyces atroroseus]|uniref:Pre-mRNA-splicing factor n=1 Tax=Talaromyces atroroseus TaxID=1441469 RepID=A0A225AQH4_TALAT|nr:Pre-mRNA-splicing factor spp2 [Talaromyces atroroseus]OKL63871.1 Pre-mRNA-splicing factor spp2 [Talaromyces atroroseus]
MVPRKEDDSGTPGKGKPFSVSFSTAPKRASNIPQNSRPHSSLRQRPRHLTHHDDGSEEEDTDPVHEEVTGFDTSAGGAISKDAVSKDKGPLVIHVESKNNWRDRPGTNRRGKNLLPQEVQAAGKEAVVETETPSISYGLSLAPSNDIIQGKEADVSMVDAVSAPQSREPLTQDEIALQALIRESEGGDKERRPDLVIESVNPEARYDETSSFRADVATRPDPASLDAYDAVPVEEFGAALLRGMGWKDGQAIGRGNYGNTSAANQVRIPQRRPGFLGIGAKDISGGKGAEVEIGAWGKAAMRKGSRKAGDGSGSAAGVYMPIVMKSKTTGEHLTEEEFKILQKEASEGKAREKLDGERSSHRSITNGRERDRDHRSHRYDDESDTDRERSRKYRKSYSSRRERSRSSGAHDRRSYRYDDDDRERSSRDTRRYRDRDDGDHRRPISRDRSHRDQTHSKRDKDYHRTRDRHLDSDRVRSDRDRDKGGHRAYK